ncbi:DUF4189 domain-containing protein [Humitalea rosea]|nr:DUF4189 domain-containing protein [Humitalea rosea]
MQSCLARCAVRQGVVRQQQEDARSRPRGRAPAPPPVPVAAPPPGPMRYYGTIYTAAPPGTGVGITVGQADRMLAHRTAENDCMNRGGAPCRLVSEFTFACAAVAHGVRQSPGTAIMTSDPSTFRLHVVGHGMANTRADAEYDAMSDCNRRDRGLTCGIVRSECSGR